MPHWQVLCIWWQVYIIDLRSKDSISVRLQLHYSHSWIVLIVPWEPLSLLAVSLMHVNSLHHWLIIRWFSIMFNFNTSIHMLEFIHWLGRDGVQDPGFCLIKSRLPGVMSYSWLYTCFPLYGWLRPYHGSIYMILFIWMAVTIPWIHTRDPFYLDGCAHTMDSCVIRCLFMYH